MDPFINNRAQHVHRANSKSGWGGNRKPSLKSLNPPDWYESHCKNIIQRFREYGRGVSGIPEGLSELELWAVGRHYGLLSPYLDWSASPYIAAFFAFEKIYKSFQFAKSSYRTNPENGVVHVWGLRLWEGVEEKGIFEVEKVGGPHFSRPLTQQAWFTKLDSKKYIDIQTYLEARGEAYLERYDLNTQMIMHAFRDLEFMNINYLSLFPDAIGVALHSNIDSDISRQMLAIQAGRDDESS